MKTLKTASVMVNEDQLSLAIGKSGQNVRLAARLVGWKIDINPGQTSATKRPVRESAAEESSSENTEEEIAETETTETETEA
jgi:N utilization substance protein A